jgi:PAS domain S-box-containing protein
MFHLPDFIYIKDRESRFLLASQKLARTVGKKNPEDLHGKTDHDFYPRKLADSFRKNEIEVIASGSPIFNMEEEGLEEDGSTIWVSTSKIPIRDSNGNIVGLVGIGRDITELKTKEIQVEQKTKDLTEANTLLQERQEEILQQQEEIRVQSELVNEERNHLLSLINSMPDRIYIKDRKSRFIIGNIHVANIMGAKNPEELVGKTDFEFYSKEIATGYYKDEQEIMVRDISLINKEEIGLDANGEEIIVSTTKVPIKDDTGQIIGIVGIGRDITAQKEVEKNLKLKSNDLQEANVLLEERQEEIQQQSEELISQAENLMKVNEELEKLSIVASKTDNVIIIMDQDGNFEWVNEGFRKRYSMTLDDFIQSKGKNITENSYQPKIKELLEQLREKKKSVSYTTEVDLGNGEVIWSRTTLSPVHDDEGNMVRIVAIDSDITEIKEAEEQIEKQRDELRTLNATKDKFFSIIAHDLKNPFHSIMGFSDLLTRSYDNIEEDKKKEFIKLINESSSSAYGLLENLLNWARTQTNKIKFNPTKIDVATITREVFQMMSVNAENKNVSLELPDDFKDLLVYADYNMIYTVIRNLVSNALKFTESGDIVSVSKGQKNGRMEISISDTGVGMSEEEKNKLFRLDEFHTTTGTSGEAGTGLGLIVCREFIIKHGGDIEIESEKGKGSTFRFTLPVYEEELNKSPEE